MTYLNLTSQDFKQKCKNFLEGYLNNLDPRAIDANSKKKLFTSISRYIDQYLFNQVSTMSDIFSKTKDADLERIYSNINGSIGQDQQGYYKTKHQDISAETRKWILPNIAMLINAVIRAEHRLYTSEGNPDPTIKTLGALKGNICQKEPFKSSKGLQEFVNNEMFKYYVKDDTEKLVKYENTRFNLDMARKKVINGLLDKRYSAMPQGDRTDALSQLIYNLYLYQDGPRSERKDHASPQRAPRAGSVLQVPAPAQRRGASVTRDPAMPQIASQAPPFPGHQGALGVGVPAVPHRGASVTRFAPPTPSQFAAPILPRSGHGTPQGVSRIELAPLKLSIDEGPEIHPQAVRVKKLCQGNGILGATHLAPAKPKVLNAVDIRTAAEKFKGLAQKPQGLFKLWNEDTFEVAQQLMSADPNNSSRPLVIDLANRNVIGGGWEKSANQTAQEESLFYRSNLYYGLYGLSQGTPSRDHRFYYKEAIQHDQAIYCGDITVLFANEGQDRYRELSLGERFKVDVLAIAGYDLGPKNRDRNDEKNVLGKLNRDDPQEKILIEAYNQDLDDMKNHRGDPNPKFQHLAKKFTNLTTSKIKLMLRAAALNGNKSIVLGAISCGAFKFQSPLLSNEETNQWTLNCVVKAYKFAFEELKKEGVLSQFEQISFAITGKKDQLMYRAFEDLVNSINTPKPSSSKPLI